MTTTATTPTLTRTTTVISMDEIIKTYGEVEEELKVKLCNRNGYRLLKALIVIFSLLSVIASTVAVYEFFRFLETTHDIEQRSFWNQTALIPAAYPRDVGLWKNHLLQFAHLFDVVDDEAKFWGKVPYPGVFVVYNTIQVNYKSRLTVVLLFGLFLEIIGMTLFFVNLVLDVMRYTCQYAPIPFPFLYFDSCPHWYRSEENRFKLVKGLDAFLFLLALLLLVLTLLFAFALFEPDKIDQKLAVGFAVPQENSVVDIASATDIHVLHASYEFYDHLASDVVLTGFNFSYGICDRNFVGRLESFLNNTYQALPWAFSICPYKKIRRTTACLHLECDGNFTYKPHNFTKYRTRFSDSYRENVLSSIYIDIAIVLLELVLLVVEHGFLDKIKRRMLAVERV